MESICGIESLSIPRCYKPKDFGDVEETTLHIFSDASESGFGICCYLRFINIYNQVHCRLIYGRSRVAPLKFVSIPRMELSAAVLAAKTFNTLLKELDMEFNKVFFYTDSQVVLGYLRNESRKFKVFVANRVQQIQDLTDITQWNYVSTKDNPADLASRGMSTQQSRSISTWFDGPKFLWQMQLPVHCKEFMVKQDDNELKKSVNVHIIKNDYETVLTHLKSRTNNWVKMVRIMAVVLEFITKLKCAHHQNDIFLQNQAKQVIVKLSQEEGFTEELKSMQHKNEVSRTSPLIKLDPFVDVNGLIRVGGRLQKTMFDFEEKHPLILPKNHKISEVIIQSCHQKVAHGGRGMTLNQLRKDGYWIIGANQMTRSVISKCVICRKMFSQPYHQKMANLPAERCTISSPFSYTGIDMFGPFIVKERRSLLKRYCVIFTCLNSRAVHLEVTSDLSTDTFIMALRRFINRRGNIIFMQSDNGTNFVGAKNELTKALNELDKEKIRRFLQTNNSDWIEWKFNTPLASNTGGVWERQIRTARRILVGLLETHSESMNTESFRTLLTEVEGIINSRPLTVETLSDVTSEIPISPSNLLTKKSNVILPPPGAFERADLYSKKYWRRMQHIANEFWSRWRKEFLINIQERQKWFSKRRNFAIGDIIIVKENVDRNDWKIGRVVNVIESSDGIIRTVDLKMGYTKTILRRPTSKIVLLVESDSQPREPSR